VIGAVIMSVLGFSIFGWTLASTAKRIAKERAQATVVDVLTPICVERFRQQTDVPAKLTEFNNASTWNRRLVIEKGGWATAPGADTPNSAVAAAYAEGWPDPLSAFECNTGPVDLQQMRKRLRAWQAAAMALALDRDRARPTPFFVVRRI